MEWSVLRCEEGNGFVAKRIFNKVYFHILSVYGSVFVEEFEQYEAPDRIILHRDIWL